DQIARGAGRSGDDGAVALDEAVEERTFAGVGAANDGQRQSVMHNAAARKGSFQRREGRVELVYTTGDFGLRCDVDIVFGEVDAGFEEGDEFDERLLDWLHAMTQSAPHLAGCLTGLREGVRFDEIADG